MTQRRSAVARRMEAATVADNALGNGDEVCLTPGADPQRTALGRSLLPDAHSRIALADTFRALADPTRVSIVLSLLRQELCTCDLAAITGVTESAVSQHLRVLRRLRLVKSRREGRLVFYSLDDLHIRILLTICLHHIQDDGQEHDGLERVLDFFPALPEASTAEAKAVRLTGKGVAL
ncbi:MAG TPA: metalloregulator ArsR/SmtB family transcription factor [Ktedonobacterales bacterium]|nr:metalloregulator ArsR/SmtB family transcription factor [Ktedonobacterales bacterium]